MKLILKISKCFAPLLILFVCISMASAQEHYVVIGAFNVEENAQKFSGYARSLQHDAQYILNTEYNNFYVYVLKTPSLSEARARVSALQKGESFKDAWVYSGNLSDDKSRQVQEPIATLSSPDSTGIEEPSEPTSDEMNVTATADRGLDESIFSDKSKLKGKLFKFTIKTAGGAPIPGEVHYVDYEKSHEIAAYKNNQFVDLVRPATPNKPMPIVCGIFGYKEEVKLIDYSNPGLTTGAIQDERGAWVIPFHLKRMEKGDVSVMYHVSFYKDAVVMLPRSKEELDELLNMMVSNPAYKITVHSHCNGKNDRKIIALGPTNNYFEMKGSIEEVGSAKKLTQLRGEAVQSYLIAGGVEATRIKLKPWGGQNMLVNENSSSAKLNDRIEIEIMEH